MPPAETFAAQNNGAKINIFTRDIFSANEILLSTKLVSVPVSVQWQKQQQV